MKTSTVCLPLIFLVLGALVKGLPCYLEWCRLSKEIPRGTAGWAERILVCADVPPVAGEGLGYNAETRASWKQETWARFASDLIRRLAENMEKESLTKAPIRERRTCQ